MINENLNEPKNSVETKEKSSADSSKDTVDQNQPPQETIAEKSFREMRERQKRDEEEKETLRKEVLFLRKQSEEQQKKSGRPDINSLSEDDLIEAGHVRPELEMLRKEAVLNYMYRTHKDFGDVLTIDNIKKLESLDPALSKMIENHPNKMEQYETTYNAIKRYGIHKPLEEVRTDERITDNLSKPKPSNAVLQSRSPLSQASTWGNSAPTEQQKREHWQWAQEQIKNLSKKSN